MDTLPSGGRTKPIHNLTTGKADAENTFDSEDASEQSKYNATYTDAADESRESSTDSGTVNEDKPTNQLSPNETNSIGSALSLSPDANPSDNNSAKYSMESDGSDQKRTLINKYVKKVKSLMKK